MPKLKYDMTGWKMWEHGVPNSKIEVLHLSPNKKGSVWVCKCHICGAIKEIRGKPVREGLVISCGNHRNHNVYDLTGDYGICYTAKKEPFYFDLEDYDLIKDIAWYSRLGYAYAKSDKYCGSMQDLIMPHSSEFMVDHIYGKRNDNRKSQLRLATRTQNNQNKRLHSNNTSGVTGVSLNKKNNKWDSYIHVNKSKIFLGRFDNIEDAIRARLKAEKEYFKDFAPQKHLFEKYNII